MNEAVNQSFDQWFKQEKDAGLKDIKLVIADRKGASVRHVNNELMQLHRTARANVTMSLPTADGIVPEHVESIITKVVL